MKPSPPGIPRCGNSPQHPYHSVALLFLTRAVDEPRQFQQSRSSRAGSEKVKAIEHPVNFQNKTQYSAHHNFTSTLLRHDRWHQVSSQSIKGSQRVGNMDDERLIVEVQQHKIIYVPKHPFYGQWPEGQSVSFNCSRFGSGS